MDNEQEKRKRIWKAKMLKSAKLFLGAAISMMVFAFVPEYIESKGVPEDIGQLIAGISLMSCGIFQIACVLNFVKAIHDPLTKNEAEELEKKER